MQTFNYLWSDLTHSSFSLNGSIVEEADAAVIEILMPEHLRNAAQRISGTPGGDGSAAIVEIAQNAFFDLGYNPIPKHRAAVHEIPDTTPPVLLSGSLNYTDGSLLLYFSETVSTLGNSFDLSEVYLDNFEPVVYEFAGLAFRRYASDPAQADFYAHVLDWNAGTQLDYHDSVTFTGCKICDSGYSGMQVEVSGLRYVRSIQTLEPSRVIAPGSGAYPHWNNLLGSFAMRNEEGTLAVKVSGIKSGIYTLHSFHHGARAQTGFDIYVSDYNGSWVRRKVAENFAGGYGDSVTEGSVFIMDIVVFENNMTNSFELEFTKTNLMGGTVSWDNAIPFNGFHLQEKVYPQPLFGDFALNINGASVFEEESSIITIALTEAQRSLAVGLSGLKGGDGVATLFEMKAGAIKDLGLISNIDTPNITVAEFPDISLPSMLSVVVDFNLGEIRFRASETIDALPAEHLDVTNIAISNFSGAACFEVFHPAEDIPPVPAPTFVVPTEPAPIDLSNYDVTVPLSPGPLAHAHMVTIPLTAGAGATSDSTHLVFDALAVTIPANATITISAINATGGGECNIAGTDLVNGNNTVVAEGLSTVASSGPGTVVLSTPLSTLAQSGDACQITFLSFSSRMRVSLVAPLKHAIPADASMAITAAKTIITVPLTVGAGATFNSTHLGFDSLAVDIPASATITISAIDAAGGGVCNITGADVGNGDKVVIAASLVTVASNGSGTIVLNAALSTLAEPGDACQITFSYEQCSIAPNIVTSSSDFISAKSRSIYLSKRLRIYPVGFGVVKEWKDALDELSTDNNDRCQISYNMKNWTAVAVNVSVVNTFNASKDTPTVVISPVATQVTISLTAGAGATFNSTHLGFDSLAVDIPASATITISAIDAAGGGVCNITGADVGNGDKVVIAASLVTVASNGSGTIVLNAALSTLAEPGDACQITFTHMNMTNVSSSEKLAYSIDGEVQKVLTLVRGTRYIFNVGNKSSHPLSFSLSDSIPYTLGDIFIQNYTTTFDVPLGAPDRMYYSSKSLGRVRGNAILVVNSSVNYTSVGATPLVADVFDHAYYGVTAGEPFSIIIEGLRLTNDTRIAIVRGYESCKVPIVDAGLAVNVTGNSTSFFNLEALEPVDLYGNGTALLFGPLSVSEPQNYTICVRTTTNKSSSNFAEGGISGGGIVRVFSASYYTTDCSQYINLNGSSVVPVDNETTTVTLSEIHRIRAMSISGVAGGDGIPVLVEIGGTAFRDVAQNFAPSVLMSGLSITEIPDTVGPLLQSGTIDYGHGTLTLVFVETIKVTPISLVNTSLLFVANNTGDQKIPIQGAKSIEVGPAIGEGIVDSQILIFHLLESQRIVATRSSATGGGDGFATRLDILENFVVDFSGNPTPAQLDILLTEIPDTISPFVVSAQLDLNDGTLLMYASETLDFQSPAAFIDLTKMFLQNTLSSLVPLDGANFIFLDTDVVTITLTESQRADAVTKSNTPGGDGTPLKLDVYGSAFLDIGANPNKQSGNLSIIEIADTTFPTIISVTIDFGYGTLLILASESTNKNYEVNASALIISNNTGVRDVPFTGAYVIPSSPTTLKFKITEEQRLAATFLSGTKSGDGIPGTFMNDAGGFYDLSQNPVAKGTNITLLEVPDTVPPYFVEVSLDLGTGIMLLTASETLKLVSGHLVGPDPIAYDEKNLDIFLNLTDARISNSSRWHTEEETLAADYVALEAASFMPEFSLIVTVYLTEVQRAQAVAISGQPGGDGNASVLSLAEGALKDLEELRSNRTVGIPIVEFPDRVRPNLTAVILDYHSGIITFQMSETMDVIPPSNVRFDKLFISNHSGNHTISLLGASVISQNGVNVSIRLSEYVRVKAVRTSSFPPNGDASAPVIDMGTGSFLDIGQNEIIGIDGIPLVEIPDAVSPLIESVSLNFSQGLLTFNFDETIDMTPLSRFNFSAFQFANSTAISSPMFDLTELGGGVALISPGEDAVKLSLLLSEDQRTELLKVSGVPGGDGMASAIGFETGAFVDLFLNPNIESSLHLIEFPDIIPPALLSIEVHFGEGGVGCGFLRCALVTFTFSEYIHEDFANVNLSRAFLGNDNLTNNVPLVGALVTNIFKYNLTVTLTELQRVQLIGISGTPGGDRKTNESSNLFVESAADAAVVGNFLDGFVLDRSGLPMRRVRGKPVLEHADVFTPNITGVVLDLNDGKVIVTCDETIDVTPRLQMVFSKMFFVNVSGDRRIPFTDQTNLLMPMGDSEIVTMQLTERQRANVIAISGQSGGDGGAAIFDAIDGSLMDIAQNPVSNTSRIAVEIPDTTPPVLRKVEYNYMTGIITFICSEIIKLNPNTVVNLTAFRIYDWKGGIISDFRVNGTLNMVDNATFHVKLLPYLRWATLDVGDFRHAQEQLGIDVPNIDNALKIDVDLGAFTDIALNPVNSTSLNMADPTSSFVIRYVGRTVVNEGHIEHAVVNYSKTFYFNGTGINAVPGMLDTARWVSYDVSSKTECADVQNIVGNIVGPSVTPYGGFRVTIGGALLAFQDPLVDHTRPHKLCYMFGDEPWKLFNVFMHVHQVNDIQRTTTGASGEASLGEPKQFVVAGYGAVFGDRVNWAPSASSSDADCTTPTMVLGHQKYISTGMNITIPGTPFKGDQVQQDLTFMVNFSLPSEVHKPFKLCYGFGIEPLKLYAKPRLSISSKYVAETTAKYAIVDTNISITVFSTHITGFDAQGLMVGEALPLIKDRIKWVVGVHRDSSEDSDDLQAYENIRCEDDPAPGTEIGFVERDPVLPIGSASFVFRVPYDDGSGAKQLSDANYAGTRLRMCYAFGSEDFHLYYGQTILPLRPRIANISSTVAVQDVKKILVFEGSLGVTENDVTKFVGMSDSCANSPGKGGMDDVAMKSMGEDDDRTYASFTFNDAPEDGYFWKLCYKFGGGPYQEFAHITLQVKRIDNVTLMEGSSVDTIVGDPLILLVDGIGIMDGDSIKLVEKGYGCGALAAGGSMIGIVSDRKASFIFLGPVPAITLCYGFQDEPLVEYPNIPLVKKLSPADEIALNQRFVEVKLRLVLNLDISVFPLVPGAPAGTLDTTSAVYIQFTTAFVADLSLLLGIASNRIIVNSLSSGSIVVDFTILPSVDGSEAMAEQAANFLVAQVENPTSELYTSSVFSVIVSTDSSKSLPLPVVISMSSIPEVVAIQNESAFSVNILTFQTSGLFNFKDAEVMVTENQGRVEVTIIREHGSAGTVNVKVATVPVTALPRTGTNNISFDYEPVETILNFTEGETNRVFSINLFDDEEYEQFFETFKVVLSLSPNEGAATFAASRLGSSFEAVVKIFDFGDGQTVSATQFDATGGYLAYLQGWGIIGNGIHNPIWVDDKGLYSVDQSFTGKFSERPLCSAGVTVEAAVQLQCNIACNSSSSNLLKGSENVADPDFTVPLQFNGTGYLATSSAIHDFPDASISVTMWVRTTDVRFAGTLLAFFPTNVTNSTTVYGVAGNEVPYYEFALIDPRSLRMVVQDHVDMTWRYPGQETGVAVNDGNWHHVVATWSANVGAVSVYVDGATVFSKSASYKAGAQMRRHGTVIVGNSIIAPCTLPGKDPNGCTVMDGTGFVGAIQNIRIYTEVLGSSGVLDDLRWPFPATNNLQLKLYWRSTTATFIQGALNASVINLADGSSERLSEEQKEAHNGITSPRGIAPLKTDTVRSPCVEDDIWYFKAPDKFLGNFVSLYNGRLQFQMMAPATSGYERTRSGMVYITGGNGLVIANSVAGFPSPKLVNWTSYSILFREDLGWSHMKTLGAVTFKEFQSILSNITGLYIRGDDRICSNVGEGEEAVYLNNIRYETNHRNS